MSAHSILQALLGMTWLGRAGRLAVLLFAWLNLKSLPLAWHFRLFRGILRHLSPFASRLPKAHPLGSVFQPVIISSRASFLEVDYNIHKSNSTYFADLDISRTYLVSCLLQRGMHRALHPSSRDAIRKAGDESISPENTETARVQSLGWLDVHLGGVACVFRAAIQPMQAYEIWTRVLTWDHKWLYLVSHIVRKGHVRPAGYTTQPWRKKSGSAVHGNKSSRDSARDIPKADTASSDINMLNSVNKPHPAILATSIAKYVFKRGRRTVPPEDALRASDLLPPKPQSGPNENGAIEQPAQSATAVKTEPVDHLSDATAAWSASRIEEERKRGMEVATHMASLDLLHDQFKAACEPALAQY